MGQIPRSTERISSWMLKLTLGLFDFWLSGIVVSKLVFIAIIGSQHSLLQVVKTTPQGGVNHHDFMQALWGHAISGMYGPIQMKHSC